MGRALMPDFLPLLVLVLCCLVGLGLIPLGLPGLWVILAGLVGYGWLTDFRTVGVGTMAIVLGLAFLGEIVEAWVGVRYAKKYGGSGRAGWGALVGGLAGAVAGVPIPIIGSVIGSFLGSFLGAALFEFAGAARVDGAVGAGRGALLGRVWATAAKTAIGLVMATIGLFSALQGG